MFTFASCEKDAELTDPSTTEIEGDEVLLEAEQVEIDLNIVDGHVHFASMDEFGQALRILDGYNGHDLEVWARNLEFETLYGHYVRLEDRVALGYHPDRTDLGKFIAIDSDDELGLSGITMAYALLSDRDGVIYIGDRAGVLMEGFQASVPKGDVDLLIQAIKDATPLPSGDQRVVYYDLREERSLTARDVTVDLECGSPVPRGATYSVYSFQVQAGRRRHSVTYTFSTQRNWVDLDVVPYEVAWQFMSAYSRSWKSRNNKYKTNHYYRYDFDVSNPNVTLRLRNTSRETKYGKEVHFITWVRNGAATNTTVNPTLYTLSDINTLSGESGHWTSHRGMGTNNRIRLECR